MNSISNRSLVYLLMVAIVISLVGTVVSLSKLGSLGITGLATDTGNVNVTISGVCSISMSGSHIYFGSGPVNGSECILNTSAGSKSTGCGPGILAVAHGLNFTNDGNQNMTVNITSDKNAASFLGGDNPEFKISPVAAEANACNTGVFTLGKWTEVSTGQLEVCNSTNVLEYDDAKDTFEIDVYLNISSSADAGGKAILTITGTC